MSKYLITVKNLDGTDPKLDEMFADGLICEGFTIITERDDERENAVAIYRMTGADIACSMAASDELTRAAYLCKAMKEAERVTRGSNIKDLIRSMVADDD